MNKMRFCYSQSFNMLQLQFGVIALVAAVGSATAYDYFDSNAKSSAERIQGMAVNLNQLLSLEEYTAPQEVQKVVQQYKSAAAKVKGKSCAVDENKFDKSFQELLKSCVAKAASAENKEALTKGTSKAISEVQLIDESLKMNAKLFPSSGSSTSPGQVAKTKAQESLKSVVQKTSTLIQGLFQSTKSAMNACVAAESKKLRARVIDAVKSMPSC